MIRQHFLRLGISMLAFGMLLLPTTAIAATKTATITASPSTTSPTTGQSVTVQLLLNTGGQVASGVELDVTYSSNLTFTGFSETNSVFNVEASPSPASGAASPLRIARVRFDSGYNGSNGLIGKLTFTATSTGAATVNIAASSIVATNDNEGSNIYNGSTPANMTISNPAPAAPSPSPAQSTQQSAASPTPAQNTSSNNTTNNTSTSSSTSTSNTSKTTTTSSPKATTSPKGTTSPTTTTSSSPTAAATTTAPSPTTDTTPEAFTPSPEQSIVAVSSPIPTFSPISFATPKPKTSAQILLMPANIAALATALFGLLCLPFVVTRAIKEYPHHKDEDTF